MADAFIQLPPQSTGLKLDTSELTVGSNTVERERIVFADPTNAAGLAIVLNSAPAGTEYAIVTRNIPSGTQAVSGTVTTAPPSNASTNIVQLNGVTVDTNSGSKSAGTLRVVIATDQLQLTNALKVDGSAVTQPISASSLPLPTNASTDASITNTQVAGGGTTAPTKVQMVGGKTNDGTPQYDILPLGAGGRSIILEGIAGGTAVPISGTVTTTPPSNASTNVAQFGGTNISTGTGTGGAGIPRVTVSSDSVVGIAAGSAVIGHVITDATSVTAATLSAETTKVIGVTRSADGAGNLLTSNSTTPSAKFSLDTNITSILGTAPTTVGKLDVKGADGDVFVRQTTGSNLHTVVDSGTMTATQGTAAAGSGAWPVTITSTGDSVVKPGDTVNNAIRVNIVAGAGSGGTAQADNSAFTEGSTTFTPIGGEYNDSPVSAIAGDGAAARITQKRALHVNLRDNAGNELAVGGGTQYNEDDPFASGSKVTMAGAIRQDVPTVDTSNDGDVSILKTDLIGRLWTNEDFTTQLLDLTKLNTQILRRILFAVSINNTESEDVFGNDSQLNEAN